MSQHPQSQTKRIVRASALPRGSHPTDGFPSATSPIVPTRQFKAEDLPLVQNFTCSKGEVQPWEEDVTNWIKAPAGQDGAVDAIFYRRSEVFLHLGDNGKLVGYGAVGFETLMVDGEPNQVWAIQWFGVQAEFQGVPEKKELRECRYGRRLFRGLLQFSISRAQEEVFLWVDPRNKPGITFYGSFGFEAWDIETIDGREWQLMRKDLIATGRVTTEAAQAAAPAAQIPS